MTECMIHEKSCITTNYYDPKYRVIEKIKNPENSNIIKIPYSIYLTANYYRIIYSQDIKIMRILTNIN